MLSSKEERLLGDISGERARGYVSDLVAIGEKVSGSEEEHKAARWLQERLSPYVDTSELEGVASEVSQALGVGDDAKALGQGKEARDG